MATAERRPPGGRFVTDAGEITAPIHNDQRITLRRELWRLPSGLTATRLHLADLSGPTVVLVHGFGQNRYTWDTSRRSLSAFLAAAGYDVFNLELRGHGLSREAGAPTGFEDYLLDVEAFAAALGPPAFWIGHSLGGAVVYAGATRTPMRGVIGIAALFRFAQANRALRLLCRASRLLKGPPASVKLRVAGQLLARLYSVSDVAGYAFPISGWAPGSIEEDLLRERLDHGFDWLPLPLWDDMSRWAVEGRFDYEDAWSKTVVPVLVLAGDLDHLMLPEDARAAYDASPGPDRTFTTLDLYSTGHRWGHLDLVIGHQAPRFVWAPIRDWLDARAGIVR